MVLKHLALDWLEYARTVTILSFLIGSILIGHIPGVVDAQPTGNLSENVVESGLEMLVCTYFGGSEIDWGIKLDFDSEGNIIVGGMTWSPDITMIDAVQSTYAGMGDGFVLKLTTSGNIVFATYFGGNGLDEAMAVLVDDDDNIIVAGATTSTNLTLVNPLQDHLNGTSDTFVAKFSPSGTLIFSTYLGGSGEERIERIGVDQYGNYLFTGHTGSSDFPTTSGVLQENHGGSDDLFVLALSSDCQTIEYATYFGNDSNELGLDIDIDLQGNIVVAGICLDSATNTTDSVIQQIYGGGTADSVIAKFTPNCTELVWSTLLGGNGWEYCDNVDFDNSNNIVVSGYTGSTDFPLIDQFYNNTAGYDVFFTIIDQNGETMIKSTYLGGNSEDRSYGMNVLSDDSIVISSSASSIDMPTKNAIQPDNSGGFDAYIALFTDDELVYASYLGGDGDDHVMGMSVQNEEMIGILGYTDSDTLATHNPIQSQFGGTEDALIMILMPSTNATTSTTDLPILQIIAIGVTGIVIIVVVAVILKKR